ncbi:MAG: methylmalonyl Co-A mutase-associated GTPase MeaB [Syntrophobacteraceae bacterium]
MSTDYAEEVLQGSTRAAARLITWLENEDDRAFPCMEKLHAHTGRAYIIGITGSPGAGKSTLTDRLTHAIRRSGLTVGIIAVDPSSPFTGGAVLGDRVRMSQLSLDPGVFIRSMATRGFLGGMAKATGDVVKVLDAFGKDIVIIETVGVGQDEVDIIGIADTTCLVLVPGLGDAIQSMKSGVMEIADIFVINKADRTGADQLWTEVTGRIEQDHQIKARSWLPTVIKTVAVQDEGVADLWQLIQTHRKHLENSGDFIEKRRQRTKQETLRMIHNELFRIVRARLQDSGQMDRMIEEILGRKRDPYGIMRDIVNNWLCIPAKDKETP